MEPRIQYARTNDGVSVAYAVMGAGPPLVQMPMPPLCHLQFERQIPKIREWHDRLADKRMLVRYDSRGTGLSERGVIDLSLQALMLDLNAVVERLGLERFDLLACIHAGPLAIAYAAQHPERLSHLVLCSAYSRGSDFVQSPEVQGARAVLDKDWHTFSETASRAIAAGWEAGSCPRNWPP